MTKEQKAEIVKISKSFANGFKDEIPLNGSGWLIVDPLSGYLNACGYENELGEIPATKEHPQILIMTFKDGSQLIPSGADLKPLFPDAKNWTWL